MTVRFSAYFNFIKEGYRGKEVGEKLHNLELRNLGFSPNIIRMIKSMRMRWTEHVACMRKGMCLAFLWKSQRERDH
jgi:hypothetical protein